MSTRMLRLAVAQMRSDNRDVAANLERAGHWARQAAAQGAQLALLPELFSSGYEISAHSWHRAEPQGGVTERWLMDTARRLQLHIGGSYLEARGEDFYNTFALATPQGGIAGRVRKSHPCAAEAYVFQAGQDDHLIDTALGRIGVAICYEASLRAVWDEMLAGGADLVLLPMSAPSPIKTWLYRQKQLDAFHACFQNAATQCAALCGVPVALANKWGPWDSELPGFWPHQRSSFPGFSHIADSDGRELARIEEGEGVRVAEVTLAPERKRAALPPERDAFKPWIFAPPPDYRRYGRIEALGRRWYAKHPLRAELARQAAMPGE